MFKDKKVLITGATGGIGNSLVEKFVKLEAIVVASGTTEEKLNDLKKKISMKLDFFKIKQQQTLFNNFNVYHPLQNSEILSAFHHYHTQDHK